MGEAIGTEHCRRPPVPLDDSHATPVCRARSCGLGYHAARLVSYSCYSKYIVKRSSRIRHDMRLLSACLLSRAVIEATASLFPVVLAVTMFLCVCGEGWVGRVSRRPVFAATSLFAVEVQCRSAHSLVYAITCLPVHPSINPAPHPSPTSRHPPAHTRARRTPPPRSVSHGTTHTATTALHATHPSSHLLHNNDKGSRRSVGTMATVSSTVRSHHHRSFVRSHCHCQRSALSDRIQRERTTDNDDDGDGRLCSSDHLCCCCCCCCCGVCDVTRCMSW